MSFPRISVVVPFYNNGDVLGDCLQSIAGQMFTDLEVIMVDDGSTDNGAEVARKWAESDPRFILVHSERGGPGGARNRGIERARGEFVALVNNDIELDPDCLREFVAGLEGDGGAASAAS